VQRPFPNTGTGLLALARLDGRLPQP